jgi:uncharacterized protein YgiM (DUF1202 family)
MRNQPIKFMAMLSILGLAAAACKPKATDSGIRYVAPKDGLNMRTEPSVTGKKMLTIPKGAQVQKLEEKPESFKIDNIEGKWTKISWQGKIGWVFGGFLSAHASDTNSTQGATTAGNRVDCIASCGDNLTKSLKLCDDMEANASHRAGLAELVEAEHRKCKSTANSEAESCENNCS